MVETNKRKGIEHYQLQEIRKIVKANGDGVMKEFRDKCREINKEYNKLEARTLGARSGGSKNVTYREQTT